MCVASINQMNLNRFLRSFQRLLEGLALVLNNRLPRSDRVRALEGAALLIEAPLSDMCRLSMSDVVKC
jgi:hypothetical protein